MTWLKSMTRTPDRAPPSDTFCIYACTSVSHGSVLLGELPAPHVSTCGVRSAAEAIRAIDCSAVSEIVSAEEGVSSGSSNYREIMSGRSFLQIPGPTNVPERILRAMAQPVIDHRGEEFSAMVFEILDGLRAVFQTEHGTIVLYPGSGTGAWEASLVNTLAPGDHVLGVSNGYFSGMYSQCARALGIAVTELAVPWGRPAPVDLIHERLAADRIHEIKAVLVVHNETSTGVTSDIGAVRKVIDATGHPALLLVDTVSSLASIDFRFDEWQVDVALCGSQKGLMLPPGTGILCVGPKALAKSAKGGSPRYYWDWRTIIEQNKAGFFPYTPATLLLVGMREALRMLLEEGLPAVIDRHRRLADGVRRAVKAWNLDILCQDPAAYSNTLTTVMMPAGANSDELLKITSTRLNVALGVGLGQLKGRAFRIGHLGWLNEVEVLGTLAAIEIALRGRGIAIPLGQGVAACASGFVDTLFSKAPSLSPASRVGD